jgi:hypothetical protein
MGLFLTFPGSFAAITVTVNKSSRIILGEAEP